MTGLRRVVADPADPETLAEIAGFLGEGGLLAYPTETVYGLGGLAEPGPVGRLQELKGRDDERPFLLLIASPEKVKLEWTPAANVLARRFWPGPLTLVLRDPDRRLPAGVRSPEGGVAVRVSPHPFLRSLTPLLPAPLLSSSANRAGETPARTVDEVEALLRGLPGGEGVLVADGGALPPSPPSTLVDCSGAGPRLLREGPITQRELERALEELTRNS